MSRQELLLAFGLIAVGAAFGCSSNDDLFQSSSELNAESIDQFVQGVLVPALTHVDLTAMVGSITPGDHNRSLSAIVGCSPMSGACLGGSLQSCAETEGFRYEYDSCSVGTATLDGAVSLAGSATSGSVSFDLSDGSSSVTGTVDYGIALDGCLDEDLSGVTVANGQLVASLGGTLTFCPARFPLGSAGLTATGSGQDPLLYQLSMNGTAVASLAVMDTAESDMLADCTIDMSTESASCEFYGG